MNLYAKALCLNYLLVNHSVIFILLVNHSTICGLYIFSNMYIGLPKACHFQYEAYNY